MYKQRDGFTQSSFFFVKTEFIPEINVQNSLPSTICKIIGTIPESKYILLPLFHWI